MPGIGAEAMTGPAELAVVGLGDAGVLDLPGAGAGTGKLGGGLLLAASGLGGAGGFGGPGGGLSSTAGCGA